MSFETKSFNVLKKVQLPQSQVEKDCNVELEGDVNKILSSSSQVSVLDYEVLDGEISYNAELQNCVVYLAEENKIGSSNSVCEFSGKIANSQINLGDKVLLSLNINENKVKFENGNAIISVVVDENVELIKEKEVKSLDSSDDDVCTKKGNITLEKFVGSGKSEGVTEEEISAKENVKKIISVEPSIIIKSTESDNRSVTVYGDTITRIIYLTVDDKFESSFVNSSFKEEIEVDNARQGMIAICKAVAKRKDTSVEILESDKGTKIALKTPFVLNVYVFDSEECEVVEDLFSTKNEVKLSSESFEMTKVCKTETLEGKIDGSLTLSDDKPRVDKIIFNGGNMISITNAYVSNKELFVEGIAKTTIVYLNDEENSLNSVEVEVPFVLSDKVDARDNAAVCTDAVLYDTDVSVRRGREIFFDGKVKASVRVCQDDVSATLVDAEKGEPVEERDYAMQYVYGKEGESLWDIAKRNKVKEEQITIQNPDAVFPLVKDDGFILFFQKTI